MLASGRQSLSTRQPLQPLEAAPGSGLRLEAQRITHQTKSVIKAKQKSPLPLKLKSFGGHGVSDLAATFQLRFVKSNSRQQPT